MRRFLAVLLVLAACGKDTTGPSIPNVAGAWTATWQNMSASGVTCQTGAIPVSINQTGATFSGAYGTGTLTCNGTSASFTGGTIANGNIQGNTVTFDLDTPDFHQSGTISGTAMSGTATWRIDVSGTPYVLNGTWGAGR